MSRLLGLGERFPDFSLQACVSAEPGAEFRLVEARELEGTWTAIFFWPLDFTFVCPTELVEFNRALREFRALGARVYGASGDSHHAHLAWRKENPALRQLEFPMLGDPDKAVATELGILDPIEQVPLRATYLVDQSRKIRWLCVNDLSVGAASCARRIGRRGRRPSCGRRTRRRPCPGRPRSTPPVSRCAAFRVARRCHRRTRTDPCCA
jgi:lipoyl-dependent peroxiredoxin subunit C